MRIVGRIESLWRYPVKSMKGVETQEAFIGYAGVYGDRLYAVHDSAAQVDFPYLTAREQERVLLYRPRFRHPEKSICPPNWPEAERAGPGLTPVYGDKDDLMVDVETPADRTLAIDDPALITELSEG
ncbi:MAG: MOSC N-terminal beta barrel domain-containing protein, partial [Acetobacteraceae bacterium]|nr:MOSC N-terminal beta barrel domain-containing protein [Acetobacteraceae bacterium]